jgi:hypothetical protein
MVMVIAVMVATLGVLAASTHINRPDGTDGMAGVGAGRVNVNLGRAVPGAVDNSAFPGPAPRSTLDEEPVATVGGSVSLSGRVEVDGEPLEGARVELTRWVGEKSASVVLQTNARGAFVGEGLVGGLWSFTAWKEPDYLRADTQRVFIDGGQAATVTIRPTVVDSISLQATVGLLNATNDVVVAMEARTQSVNASGEVVGIGANGTATIIYPPGYQGPAVTGVVDGVGEIVMRCVEPSNGGRLVISFGGKEVQLDVPGCQRRASTTTAPGTTSIPPVSATVPGR